MFETHLKAIKAESSLISRLASVGDLAASVPGCPKWSLSDLVLHVGTVQRSWSRHVLAADSGRQGRADRVGPGAGTDLSRWSRESTARLVSALEAAGDASPCWTWWGEPRTSGAVARHQVQEAAVHRWDAQSAVGEPEAIDAAIADDGVSEYLEVMLGGASSMIAGTVSLMAFYGGASVVFGLGCFALGWGA